MPAPTLVSYTETASWVTSGASKSTALVSWQTGDIVAVLQGSENNLTTLGVPTATGLTFTSQKASTFGTGTLCGARVSAVVAGSTSSSAIAASGPSGAHWGFGVWVVRSSTGIGQSAEQHTTTRTVSMTPLGGADGLIIWGAFDFAAGTLGAITPVPSNTRQRAIDGTAYALYVADLLDQTSAGAVSYGVGGSGGGPWSLVVLEFKVASGGGGGTQGLFMTTSLSGVGVGGPFYRDPLQAPHGMVRHQGLYVPERLAA